MAESCRRRLTGCVECHVRRMRARLLIRQHAARVNDPLTLPCWCWQAVKEAVREATGGAARPVDPREAAKGRLDQVSSTRLALCKCRSAVLHCIIKSKRKAASYLQGDFSINLQVQVRDWGSGNPNDLGDLEVASVSSSAPSATEPLYQQLAKRLQTLEVSTLLAPVKAVGGQLLLCITA